MQEEKLPIVNFSARLKMSMDNKKMKQAELGSIAGLSKVAISRYLSGERRPGADELYRIASVLGVSMEWLIAGDSNGEKITDWQQRAEAAEKELSELKKAIRKLMAAVSTDD